MTRFWLLGFGISAFVALLGMVAGWWLRGRVGEKPSGAPPRPRADRRSLAEQALQGLHAAAETVRSCVQEHIECIQTIESELKETSATEPAILSNAADSIIAANGLVQHRMGSVQTILDDSQEEIRDHLSDPFGLLITFASLDRQKHIYRQVLRSLEQLAVELVENVQSHGERLQRITNGLEEQGEKNLSGVTAAVSQIFDAADDVQQKMGAAEEQLGKHAEQVHMQAVLSHVDLLTSLPNRRAFEAELEQHVARGCNKSAYFAVALIDLDNFGQINRQYGHQGGDVILRQAAGVFKQLMRGKDVVARWSGDTYAVLFHQTTLHDALPKTERLRTALERAEFSHGNFPLRMTASLGVAQLQPEESPRELTLRAEQSLRAARKAGGNNCYWHDGRESHAVSSAFKTAEADNGGATSLTAMFRRSLTGEEIDAPTASESKPRDEPILTGRSLFVANLQRRMSEWKRGGPAVSVFVLRVDQMLPLVTRFGPTAGTFLKRVLGRLLAAVTREMDERCELEEGMYAILLPGLDESNALAVAERLQSQVRQCKVRMDDALWSVTASIGVANCSVGSTVVEIVKSAEGAMKRAMDRGGDAICVGEPVQEPAQAVLS